jgi:hypothetical protein
MCRRTIDLYRKYGVTYLRRHNTDPMKPWLSDPSAPLEEIRAFLRKMEVYNSESCIAVIKAYLLCTCEASDPSFWPAREAIPSATFDGIKDKTGLPRLWLEDLAADLLNRPLRQATDRRTTKTLLWNTRTGDGEIFDLVLETIPYDDANHERTLYPNPLFSLVMLDMDFVESMNSAWQSVTQTYKFKPGNYDIRWSFQSHRHPLPNYIAGPSASGALASALANLFAAKQ